MTTTLIPFLELPEALQFETRTWRNAPCVSDFFKLKHITEAMHRAWIELQKCPNSTILAYGIKVEDTVVGVTYFHSIDRDARIADWGLYIYAPELRGRGIGHAVLTESIRIARDELHLETLFLDVLQTNMRARALYEHHGFTPIADGAFLRYQLKLSASPSSTQTFNHKP